METTPGAAAVPVMTLLARARTIAGDGHGQDELIGLLTVSLAVVYAANLIVGAMDANRLKHDDLPTGTPTV